MTAMRFRTGLGLASTVGLLLLGGCASETPPGDQSVIVLGFDGMDWDLSQRMIAEGKLPNFERLMSQGTASPLGTSVPPLSPVAWSNFITGMDSGGHGIFDFIHRHPDTMIPYLSTSEAGEAGKMLTVGKWQFPLSGGEQKNLRQGTPFWEVLEDADVRTEILRMPANFPPTGTATRELSGMGTPDIHGTYGTFSFYTSEIFFEKRDIGGGEIYPLDLWESRAEGSLYGPDNPFLQEQTKLELPFTIFVNPEEPEAAVVDSVRMPEVAKLIVDDEELVLAVGEWSDWLHLDFEMMPTQSLPFVARFYLRSVRPEVELYVTPLNMDPMSPALPISTPDDYAAELAEATGTFYTQGMPEDTLAHTEDVLTRDEFLEQSAIAGAESAKQYEYVLSQFEGGLLFYYSGNLDLVSHIMWGAADPSHPGYVEERDAPYAHVVEDLYVAADEIVGYTLDNMKPGSTLVVMSDHGFASWKRAFHLNRWLEENGYLALKNPDLENDPGFFLNVDWSRTRAYNLGLNGLYINTRGREKNGVVAEVDRLGLAREIGDKLLAVLDPESGKQAITKVYLSEEYFEDREHLEIGPDMVVGYAREFAGSNESSLGEMLPVVFEDNLDRWTGDHRMDHEAVPGILYTNKPLKKPATSLRDLAASILAEFGIETFPPARAETE